MPEPPGPRGAEIFSVLNCWRKDGLLEVFGRLAPRYGDVVCLKLPGRRAYLLNHPDHIRHALIDNRDNYLKSKGNGHAQRYFGDSMQLSNGDEARRLRHAMNPVIQPSRMTRDYCGVVVDESRAAVDRWTTGTRPALGRDLTELALAASVRIHFGTQPESETAEIARVFRDALDPLSGFLPPDWVPVRANRNYRAAIEALNRAVYARITARRASGPTGTDLLSCFVSLGRNAMTDVEIRNELVSMMAAGYTSVGLALSQTIRQVASRPAIGDLLHSEATALAGRPATYQDLASLPYSEQVVKESLRAAPPAGALMRIVAAGDEIAGWTIRRGARVFISPWVMHRDPRWFDEPLRFKPERWTADFERGLPPCAYFPFGRGPRACIAGAMSMVMLRLMLVTIMQRYRLRAADSADESAVRPFNPADNLPVVLEELS